MIKIGGGIKNNGTITLTCMRCGSKIINKNSETVISKDIVCDCGNKLINFGG